MSRLSLSTIKGKFQTGDRPSEADYVDLIDSTSAQATDLGSYGNNEVTITGIENATVIDNFSATDWRMVKYMISIVKADSNKYAMTELTILVDGSDISVSEYGTIDNNGNVGTVSVSKAGSTVNVTVTPEAGVTPVTVRFARMGLKA